MDCSLPDSSVHGILQARIPERVQSYDLTASKSSLWFLHKLPHALKFSKSSFLLQSTRSFTLLSWRGYTLHTTHHWSMSLHPSSFSFHGLFFTLKNKYHRTLSLSLSLSLSLTHTLSLSPPWLSPNHSFRLLTHSLPFFTEKLQQKSFQLSVPLFPLTS